jgi:hypothetical protein
LIPCDNVKWINNYKEKLGYHVCDCVYGGGIVAKWDEEDMGSISAEVWNSTVNN